ncbi:MAG: hypothetical protein AABW58_04110 [Nanoarchaeota archaeon]
MYTVILDTDFILHSIAEKVDFFNEIKRISDFTYKICIFDKTFEELKNKKNEKLALSLLKNKVKIIKTNSNEKVDNLILSLNKKNIIICTSDKELKEKLKKRNIPVIHLRKRKYLVIENVL